MIQGRLPRGVTRTANGYRAGVCVQGRREQQRFPRDTPLSTIVRWQRQAEYRLAGTTVGTLADDVRRYLKLKAGMASLSMRARDLGYWVAALGPDTRREEISREVIRATLLEWRETRAASTCNHRRAALSDLYAVLDGRSAPNPVRDCANFREPDAQPRGLPMAAVAAIFDAMPESRTKIQLRVLAYTGIPPATMARLERARFDADAGTLWVPGRLKGRGTRGRSLQLATFGVEAMRAFDAAKLWGERVRTTTSRTVLNRAVATVRRDHPEWNLPAWVRPYDLRHSLCAWVYAVSGGNIAAVADAAGHADYATSRRYALAAAQPVQASVARALSEELRRAGVPATATDREIQAAFGD